VSELREALAAAIDDDTGAAPEVDTSVDTSPATTGDETPPDSAPAVASEGSVRDALGRFVPKAKAPEAGDNAPAAAPEVAPVVPDQPAVATAQPNEAGAAAPIQPPAGMSPLAREHWAALPLVMQQEIQRREVDMQRFVNDTAQTRQVGDAFMHAIQPHMMAIQAEGVDPITAVTNLMSIGSRLRFGTPAEKANTVAQIVKAYGIDVRGLDGALDETLNGNRQQPQDTGGANPQYIQQLVQQQLAPIMQAAQQRQQAAAQQIEVSTRTTMEQFASDPKNEFFNDLRGTMADMIEVAERQGYMLTLADAYQRAAMLHPEVSRVMLARQQGVNAQKLTAAARTAKAAAVSVRGSAPVGNPDAVEPSSIRESIEAAIESHSRV
jgi:hypothetical protein